MIGLLRSKLVLGLAAFLIVAAIAFSFTILNITHTHAAPSKSTVVAPQNGNLDCNGLGLGIKPTVKRTPICADFTTIEDGIRYHGLDNGQYIGHDEPSTQFTSTVPGSGNNVQWTLTLPRERSLPATQTFENMITFWFSMAICDPNSFPNGACTADSDTNNPNVAGSALLELQLYPPGDFGISLGCSQTQWCAALNIDSLEVDPTTGKLNPNCTEPVNFANLETNGVPASPPAPGNPIGVTDANTLLMNQGDHLRVTVRDTPAGLLNRIDDLSTGKSGFMVASAANGFANTNPTTCALTPFSFHPEFSTAKFGNFVFWAALQANVNVAIETGHFNVCDKVDTKAFTCVGNEGIPGHQSPGDADDPPCASDPSLVLVPGCTQFATGGDLDFDGTSYEPDWPDGTRHNAPSVRIHSPLSGPDGPNGGSDYSSQYPIVQFETDVPASENSCNFENGTGCTVPPAGADFYPYFSTASLGVSSLNSLCAFEFGNNAGHGLPFLHDFGKDAQYGTPNLAWFGGTSSGGPRVNPCS